MAEPLPMPDHAEFIKEAMAAAGVFAQGRTVQWTTECPRCRRWSLTILATKGVAHRGVCSSHACLRWMRPDLKPVDTNRVTIPKYPGKARNRKSGKTPDRQQGLKF